MMKNVRARLIAIAVASILPAVLFYVGCDSGQPPADLGTHKEALMYTSALANEGSCQFLACCSSFSTQEPLNSTYNGYVCKGWSTYDAEKGTSVCDPTLKHNST